MPLQVGWPMSVSDGDLVCAVTSILCVWRGNQLFAFFASQM